MRERAADEFRSPFFVYANNEPKSTLARDLGDCRDNKGKLAKCVFTCCCCVNPEKAGGERMEEEMETTGEAETVAEAAKEAVETLKEKSLEELAEENKRLQEENERLKNRSIKERMYDKINVSVRTIDIFIGCMCVLFVAVVVMGMLK